MPIIQCESKNVSHSSSEHGSVLHDEVLDKTEKGIKSVLSTPSPFLHCHPSCSRTALMPFWAVPRASSRVTVPCSTNELDIFFDSHNILCIIPLAMRNATQHQPSCNKLLTSPPGHLWKSGTKISLTNSSRYFFFLLSKLTL